MRNNKVDIRFDNFDGILYTDSIEVARIFNKHHHNVLRDIRVFIERNGDSAKKHFIESFYVDKQNRRKDKYLIDKTGLRIFVAGYNSPELYPIKEALLEQLDEIDSQPNNANSDFDRNSRRSKGLRPFNMLSDVVMEKVESKEFWRSVEMACQYTWSVMSAKIIANRHLLGYDDSEIDWNIFAFESIEYIGTMLTWKLNLVKNITISRFYDLIEKTVEEYFDYLISLEEEGINPF
jgi:Rha family phage regulatory protein